MKKALFFLALFTANIAMAQDLVILHTNDIHSHLNGGSPEAEYTPLVADSDLTLGGMSRIAGFIKSEKEKNNGKLLVVDGGDFLMGTLFQTLETGTGFQLNLMKKIGFDFVTLGNHEFDFGPNALASIIDNNQRQGAIPKILSTNYVFSKDGNDAALVKKFKDGTILRYSVIEKNGYKIGLFGILGHDAERTVAGNNKVSFKNSIAVAKKTTAYLKNIEKVDLVVVLSHGGVTKTKEGNWEGADYKLAKAVPDIDIVIGGHTHTELHEMVRVGNAIVVQTGSMGKNVGRIAVTFDKIRKPTFEYKLVAMDDNIPGDPEIQKLIDEKSNYISKTLLAGMSIQPQQPIFETGFDLKMDKRKPEPGNLGPFITDAVYYMLNKENNQKVDMTLVATGIIRSNILVGKTGMQNISDIFNIMPLREGDGIIPGSPLGKIYLKGSELKRVIELILVAYQKNINVYLYSTGMQIKYNPDKGLFNKVSEITIGTKESGYRKVSFSKSDKTLYCVAANRYILGFIGSMKRLSYGLINVVGKNADGSVIKNKEFLIDMDKNSEGIQEAKEWLAILDYVRSFPDTNGNGIPDMPEVYRTKVNPFTIITETK
jgi:5'-nucleotidase / UDP-sugar diphosphatase